MKVLICIPCLMTGGTEIQTLNLVHALVEGGHEVVTACYFEHTDYMIGQYEAAGSKVVLFSPEGVRMGGFTGVKFLWRNIRKVVREFRPDVAHVQYMAPGAQPILILKMLGVKNILATAHTNADIYPNLRLIHFLQKHVVRVWTCITCKAEEGFFGESQLYNEDTNVGRHNHFTIYNSLPYGMKFCERESIPQVSTIGVVSRLEQIKGMDLVIPAFARVHGKHPDVELIVVGDGSLKVLMQQQARELGVADSIKWAGRQHQSELYKWYGKMDIVLMPSRSEGFGLTAIEAMANGCVVIASNTGGLPEVVKDGKVGLLHQPESIDDMVDSLYKLLEDKMTFNQLKENSIDYVSEFSFDKYSKLLNNLYQIL